MIVKKEKEIPMGRVRKFANVNQELCVACGSCVKECPLSAITILKGSYAVVSEKCVGCGKCSAICPASVITLVEKE